jgi:hypothetical protein
LNLHVRVTETEYRRILAEANRQGTPVSVQNGEHGPIFASMQVKLFVNPSARYHKSAQINDRTYSRTILHIEEKVDSHADNN